MAVTKTHPPETVRAALALGITDFGENRVEEGVAKIAAVRLGTWHMVGHVQSRKAREAAGFDYVHSVDGARLAGRLGRFARERQAGAPTPLPVFLECNVSGEAAKYGLRAERFFDDPAQRAALIGEIESILAAEGVRVVGLMTMAPLTPDPETTRPVFQWLRRLRDELARRFPQGNWSHLSMGMSDDFEVAIEEGATHVRIGRAIFGERRA